MSNIHRDLRGANLHAPSNEAVENHTGVTITETKCIKFTAYGADYPAISVANGVTEKVQGIVVNADIIDGGAGYVCCLGLIADVDTSAWAAGTLLYCNATGDLVIAGAGGGTAPVAVVLYQHATEGILYVRSIDGADGVLASGQNAGTGGVGLYLDVSGASFRLRNINAGSSKVTVTLDAPNNEVDLDVAEAQINHNSLLNTHNLTTDISHASITGAHNLTTDINHASITGTHNLTTDVDHASITNTHNLTTDINHASITGAHNLTTDITHSSITGLTTTDAGHTQFALLAGRAGGQILTGGTAASEGLTLKSTSDATKGPLLLSELNDITYIGNGSVPDARKLHSIDLQMNRDNTNQTVRATAGSYNVILGGAKNYISTTGHSNVVLGGEGNRVETASTSCVYNAVIGGGNNSINGGLGYSAVLAGTGNAIRGGAQYSVAIGGSSNLIDASNSTSTGSGNNLTHQYVFACGRGSASIAANDFIWGNNQGSGSFSTTSIAFRLNGDTADVHVGRHINSATTGANTNILKLHTTNASNQSNYYGIKCDVNATTSGFVERGIKTGTLTATQVRKLNATPVTLVAAPGAGRFIRVHSFMLFMDWNANDYDSVAAGEDFQLQYATTNTAIAQVETVGFMDQVSDQHRGAHVDYDTATPSTPGGWDYGANAGEAVELTVLTGELAAADADANGDSPLKYHLEYEIITLLT